MSLQALEKLARKNGSAVVMVSGEEFEVSRKGKPGSRRCSYRHGKRHMGRDEAERLLPAEFVYDPAKMFPFCRDPRRVTG